MPFFVVTHNVTDSKFYKENVEAMIGSLPNCDPINEGDEGLHKKDLHQLSVNFPSSANGDVKIGWCVFESKPGSSWTAKSMKEWQDADKKPWAVQDVTEINCPVGHKPYYAQSAKKNSSCAIA